jgi:hypothetical protein
MPEQTLTDTASFAELRAALTAESTPPVENEPAPVEEAPVTDTPVETADKPADEPLAPPVETPAGDRKPRRFSELTRRTEAAEAKAAELARELESLRTAASAAKPAEVKPPQSEPDKPVPPDAATFSGTWEQLEAARAEYAEKLVDWKVKTHLAKAEADKQAQAAAERAAAVHQTWQQQYDAAVDRDERAVDAVAKVGAVVSKLGITDVIKESDIGMEIVLHLDADKSALDKLGKMSIASAAREIGRIEAAILAKKSPATAAASKPLPAPPVAVGGSAGGTDAPRKYENMSIGDLRKAVRELR